MKKYLLFFISLLFITGIASGDSEVTIGGKTGQAVILQDEGVSIRPSAYRNFVGSGVECEYTGGKQVCTFEGGGSGGGGDTFKTWDMPTGDNLVAESTTDTVTFLEGAGITITGVGATDTLTISSSAATSLTGLTDVNSATADTGRLLIGNGMKFDSVVMSGDATIAATGDITIPTNAFHNGTFAESFDARITSDGATITLTVTNPAGGNLTPQFSSGNYTFSGGSTIALTAGASDAAPQNNFIYVLESAPTILVKSTTAFPTTVEHIRVGYFFAPTAAYVAADGAYINQNWNDHLSNGNDQGHLAHLGEWIRLGGAHGYSSGLGGDGDASTYVKRTNAVPDTVYLATAAGVLYQFHRQAIGAKDTSGADDFHVINQDGDAYADGSDLYDFLDDSTGLDMKVNPARYYNLVIWMVGNKTGEYSPLMVNLPDCSYSTQAGAELDSLGCDVYALPRQFVLDSNTGHLIARLTMKWTNSGSDLELISTVDLRGTQPTVVTGGGGSGHDPVSLAGQDYLTISGQILTAGEIEPDDLAASDFGGFTCNGTTCALDSGALSLTGLSDVNSDTATAGRLLVANGSTFDSVALSGDVSLTGPGVATITSDGQVQFTFDGGGSAITAGEKTWLQMPFAFTITSVEVTAEASCNVEIDFWEDSYANFPPAVGDTICGSGTCPTLAAAQKSQDSTLTSWDTSLAQWNYLLSNVEASPTCERVVVSFQGDKL